MRLSSLFNYVLFFFTFFVILFEFQHENTVNVGHNGRLIDWIEIKEDEYKNKL